MEFGTAKTFMHTAIYSTGSDRLSTNVLIIIPWRSINSMIIIIIFRVLTMKSIFEAGGLTRLRKPLCISRNCALVDMSNVKSVGEGTLSDPSEIGNKSPSARCRQNIITVDTRTLHIYSFLKFRPINSQACITYYN